ncbi:MAG: hypothetical protein ABMA25_20925, partial [Ilumatobacteraceae bacterium]
MRKLAGVFVVAALGVAACSDDSASPVSDATVADTAAVVTTDAGVPETGAPDTSAPAEDGWLAGAASNSIVPTAGGDRAYLDEAPGWAELDPNDIGVFVPTFDVGRVDVGNGESDAAWVHDDLRTTAVALRKGNQVVVMANADVY